MELEFHQMAMKYENLRIWMAGYQARLMASLAEQGQMTPVLVVAGGTESEGYVLIDGYRRLSALRALGRDTVEAMVLPLCEASALIFYHGQNSGHKRSALEEGWLLRELMELHGMNQAELSHRLQRSDSWVSRRLSMVRELPESVQHLLRRGKLCDHAAMKYLVPLARANRSDCEKLASNLQSVRISDRQMERIYMSWRSGDAEQRRRIVQKPLLFLKTAEQLIIEPEKGLCSDIQSVLEDMEVLSAVSGRARRRIRIMRSDVLLPDTVITCWRTAQSSFESLAGTMEKRVDAGYGKKGSDSAAQV